MESSPEDDDTAIITFPYFTTGTRNGLKKKKVIKKTKGRICAMLTVTTKHLPELQCFVTIILCRIVHVFCHRTTAKGSEKEMKKKVLFIRYISSPSEASLLHDVQQENVFKGKHDHIFVQKARSSRSPL